MAALPNGQTIPQDILNNVADDHIDEPDYSTQSVDQLLNPTEIDPLAPAGVSKPDTGISPALTADQQRQATTDSITAAVAPLNNTIAELQQRLMFLTGQIVEQRRAPAQQVVQPDTTASPKEFTYDLDGLATEMATNAPAALVKYNQAYLAHVLPDLKESIKRELLGEVNGQFTRRDQASSTHQAQVRDAQRAATEYPEVLANENGNVKFIDNDFANEAGKEFYANILLHTPEVANRVQSGDQNWGVLARPGDFFSAISTVAARRLKSGKYPNMQPNNTNGNGNGKPSLRQVINTAPQQPNGTTGPTGGKPTTIDSFFKNPAERTLARRLQKSYGISEESYVRQCAAAAELEI